MENNKTNEQELTSTMGSLLSSGKEERVDTSDSTPTSSTDAFTTASASQLSTDDPISSTSSDVLDSKRTDRTNDNTQISSISAVVSNFSMSSLNSTSIGDHTSSIVSEKDLLDMNITDTTTEKITENVDDIVQDLENLLGEPTTTFDFTIKSRDNKQGSSKDISMDLDEFSVEFQMLEDKSKSEDAAASGAIQIESCKGNQYEDGKQASQSIQNFPVSTTRVESGTEFIKPDVKDEPHTQQDRSESFVSIENVENVKKGETDNIKEKSNNFDVSSSKEPSGFTGDLVYENTCELMVKHNEETIESVPIEPTNCEINEIENNEHVLSYSHITTQMDETQKLLHQEIDFIRNENENSIVDIKMEQHAVEKKDTIDAEPVNENIENDEKESEVYKEEHSREQTLCENINKNTSDKENEKAREGDVQHYSGNSQTTHSNVPFTFIHDNSRSETEDLQQQQQLKSVTEQLPKSEIILTSDKSNSHSTLKPNEKEKKENQMDCESEYRFTLSDSCQHTSNSLTEECQGNVETITYTNSEKIENVIQSNETNRETTLDCTEPPLLNENTPDYTHEGRNEHQQEYCTEEKLASIEPLDMPISEGQISLEVTNIKTSQMLNETNVSTQLKDNRVEELFQKSFDKQQNEISLVKDVEQTKRPELENIQDTLQNIDVEIDLNYECGKASKENTSSNNDNSISNITTFNDVIETPTVGESNECHILDNRTLDAENPTLNIADDTPDIKSPISEGSCGGKKITCILPSFNTSANLQDCVNEESSDIPSCSNDYIENLNEDITENNMLPLVIEDVPDINLLSPISSLSTNKPEVMSNIPHNLERNNTLSEINTISSEVQQSDMSFEPCMHSALPTVDEIFAEPNDQQSVDLPDDNLETLLVVADFQGECETGNSYEMSQIEDTTNSTEDESKIQSEKSDDVFTTSPEQGKKSEHESLTTAQTIKNHESMGGYVEESKQIKHVIQNQKDKLKEPLVINVDETDKEKEYYSPKITIKPIKLPTEEEVMTSSASESDEKDVNKCSLKMTITKQSDTMHSILKIYDPSDAASQQQENCEVHSEQTVPKLIIKPVVQPNDHPNSPKMSTRSSKQVFSPSSSGSQRSASPRITIKPIVKPENIQESVGPVKITIKPVLKPEESYKQKHSPKLTIKPIIKPEDENSSESKVHSPRVTIKPVMKESEQASSPRITIKPIVKPENTAEPASNTPRVTIKPILKPHEKEKSSELSEQPVERSSPKITIKPIIKPQEHECHLEDYEESTKERIVLKINKGTLPSSSKEQRKREISQEDEKSEKTPKIKLKFSKEGGHPHIVQDKSPTKRSIEQEYEKVKRQKIETENLLPGVTITPIGPTHSKLKEMLSKHNQTTDKIMTSVADDDNDVTIIEEPMRSKPSPIVISEESNQDSVNISMEVRDPISEIPVFEITPECVKTINPQTETPITEIPSTIPAPRKRGRPRKVPLQVREDFKDPKEDEPKPIVESTRPKRSCRGQSVRTTLGIKPRKPRGPGRGRGGKRGMGTRSTSTPTSPLETSPKSSKEPKFSAAKVKPPKEDLLLLTDKTEVKQIEIDDGFRKSPSQSILAPPQTESSTTDRADIVMYEEETRMSAETNSRAQTPAKQVVTSTNIPSVDLVEESQSSVQSTATTESVKIRKGPRLEVHQEPEGAVISADQLAEYYWSGGGPYMLQEQVAQFLGIKSFKRKYPNIPRRVVDMQERDFIRESGLAGEAMCDLGLTAVSSSDILDIMYSDFQDKYEEYCKHQRDRQAKDLTNKQKALSLAASQEKTKMDITQQAVQSAATWNTNFNKARKDQRKACMDLQTLTVHFPKGKMKQINKSKIGNFPVALVPGQFTDYYREFTPTEINNLPLNTMCYDSVTKGGGCAEMECDSQTDGSGSESESTTSDSDSSYSGSSDAEDCTLCHKAPPRRITLAQ